MDIQNITVGMKVMFGRNRGEQTVAEVIKVNRTRVRVRQTEARLGNGTNFPVGTVWNVTPTLLSPVVSQSAQGTIVLHTEAELMTMIGRVYLQLEPEHLSCDGERSAAQVRLVRTRLHNELRRLCTLIGRHVSEDEAFDHMDANAPPATVLVTPPANIPPVATTADVARRLGLPKDIVGTTILCGGHHFSIVRYEPRNYKYPIIGDKGGKRYKLSIAQVLRGMAA